jgi:phosphohistidine swiveling domain-containing protein
VPPTIVELGDPQAADASLTGAKAAVLARAAAAGLPVLPGFVRTTASAADDLDGARAAYDALAEGGRHVVIVRSSSTVEDGATTSMAGQFRSVLGVRTWSAARDAIESVLASGREVSDGDQPMAVLVQRQLFPTTGGILFGADPVTGRLDRLVVSSTEGGPDRLVSGEVDGWTAVLSRRGRVLDERRGPTLVDPRHRPSRRELRVLARLARRAANLFGGPQDIEWAIDGGEVVLLQSRPITTLHGPVSGPVLGPGPLAETFPEPLTRLEQELWVEPLRDALREALVLVRAASSLALRRSPVVTVVAGRPVADLEVLGVYAHRRPLHRLDPRAPLRRLESSWRVGRLTRAMPVLARDVVDQVDADLAAVPALGGLTTRDLLAILDNGRQTLRALHGYEALAGMLLPPGALAVSAASVALTAIAEAGDGAADCEQLVAREPVVLTLLPPRVGPLDLPGIPGAAGASAVEPVDAHPLAVAREALRLRARWTQELTARAAWALGERAAAAGVLPQAAAVRVLGLEELRAAALRRVRPADLADRVGGAVAPPAGALPLQFRLAADGTPVALPSPKRGAAVGAGGGVGRGPVHLGADPQVGDVLVVEHLDPRLATVIPRLAALVGETGSPLSHLAILAREFGVPTVVGYPGARARFRDGEVVEVDGSAGTVEAVADLAGTTGSDHR